MSWLRRFEKRFLMRGRRKVWGAEEKAYIGKDVVREDGVKR